MNRDRLIDRYVQSLYRGYQTGVTWRQLMVRQLNVLLTNNEPAWFTHADLYHGNPCWRR